MTSYAHLMFLVMSVYLMFLVMSVYRDGRPDFGTKSFLLVFSLILLNVIQTQTLNLK